MIPPWIVSLFQGLLSLSALAIVWKLAWAVRGWVEAQKTRAENEQQILHAIERFGSSIQSLAELISKGIEEQRETNKQIWTAVQLHAARLNKLEDDDR